MRMRGLESYRGRRVGILGMARSGLAAARALKAAGAEVLAFDDKPEALARAAAGLGLASGRVEDVVGLAALVVSPGVPLTHPAPHPVVALARGAEVRLTCDIDLFAEVVAASADFAMVIGVTGTNGKSTTSALIHHLLAESGKDALLGGNIGRPVFDLDPPRAGRYYVLELSSFQLDLCSTLHPDVAVWLNITPDHLDRHGDLESYVRAKRSIFRNLAGEDWAVVGIDDEPSRRVVEELRALPGGGLRIVPVSAAGPCERGVYADEARGVLVDARRGPPAVPLARLDRLPRLRGRHNWQNAAAAAAAALCCGLEPDEIERGLASFEGLPHRMEEVASARGVLWVNDSKATNPDAASKSLSSYADIFWIAGGRPKPGGFASLRPLTGAVRRAYLIGEAAGEIERDLGDLVPVERSGTLEAAVASASRAARASGLSGAAVLLAPACASYDQFANFEARGDAFRALAKVAAATGSDAA